jgi:porin
MGRCRIKTAVAIAAAILAASSSTCFAQTSGTRTSEAMDTAAAALPPPAKAPSVAVTGALTQFLGASVAGDGSNSVRYGGRLDIYVTIPGSTLGMGDRLSISFHPELVYGKNTNTIGGSTILPVNTAMLLPSNGSEDFDLSVSVTQKIGSAASVTFGKINLLDLAAKTPIVGGGGLEGFQNIALAAPPSGLVPPSLFGAMLSAPTKSGILSLWIYDPVSTTNRTGFEHPFSSGIAALVSATFPVKIGGKTGYQNIKMSGNTRTAFDLRDLPALLLPPGSTILSQRKGAWNVTYSFQQFIWENPQAQGVGWGVFGQIGLSDGNPTPLDWSGLIGIAGNPWTSRPADKFGIAYFRQSFSDVLAQSISPVLDLKDEQGIEAFYTAQLGKVFRLTGNIQIIDPATARKSTAVLLGVRLRAGF